MKLKYQDLYEKAKLLIPGGTQLLSKRPEMFAPGRWPAYYREANGCEIIDVDGRRYLDMSIMGIGTCLLGYNDPHVSAAVIRRVQMGSMSSLNNPEEVELAELVLQLHPWAQQVRYARTGGEAMSIAVRIARALTGRSRVAFCGYHGWHDWYLAANLAPGEDGDQLGDHLLPGLKPNGVPEGLAGTAMPFHYNRIEELVEIIEGNRDEIAAVVMEPTRYNDPDPGFLEEVRRQCDACGAVLVVDEITAGWRFVHGGAHLRYNLVPDIAVFGKALANGHPMAAVVGKRDVMEAAQSTFISSTYWTEGVGPAAAIAAVRKLGTLDVPGHLEKIATLFRTELGELACKQGVKITFSGHPAITLIKFEHPQPRALQTLFTTRLLDHGVLAAAGFYASMAHDEENISRYLEAAALVLPEVAEAVEKNDVLERLGENGVKHSGFSRLS